MQTVEWTRLFSNVYRLSGGQGTLTELRFGRTTLPDKVSFRIGQASYLVRSHGFGKRRYSLSSDGRVVAEARVVGMLEHRVRFPADSREYVLRSRLGLRLRCDCELDGKVVGSIRAADLLARRIVVDLPPTWSRLEQAFALCVVMLRSGAVLTLTQSIQPLGLGYDSN